MDMIDQAIRWQDMCTGVHISRDAYRAISITEAIAASDRYAGWLRRVQDEPGAQKYADLSKLLCWFRDSIKVDSIAGVLDAIETRAIPLNTIRVLALELGPNSLPPTAIRTAIRDSYPGLREQMQAQDAQAFEQAVILTRHLIEQIPE